MQSIGLAAAFLTGAASNVHCDGICSGAAISLIGAAAAAPGQLLARTVFLHGGCMLAGAIVGIGAAFDGLQDALPCGAVAAVSASGPSIAGVQPSPPMATPALRALKALMNCVPRHGGGTLAPGFPVQPDEIPAAGKSNSATTSGVHRLAGRRCRPCDWACAWGTLGSGNFTKGA